MHGALLQELSWIPSSEEIHLEQIYRIRDWWDVIQLVEKHWQNNTTDTHSWCGWFHQVAGVQCWQPYNTLLDCKESSSASQTEETRNNRDRVYHSHGLCWKLSHVVQDEIQGYHWNKDQCTLHPVVIYFKNDGVLHHISLHIIYDDLEHDSCFVHELSCRE